MPKPWKVLSSQVIMQSPYLKVKCDTIEVPNGHRIDQYYTFEIHDWARVVPVTPDNRLILVEQYRHGVQKITREFPAGMMEDHDTSSLQTAQRELLEETGYRSDDWTPLGSFKLGPARIKNGFHLFLARNCQPAAQQNLDAGEEIAVHLVSFTEYERLFENGEILDTDSALAWQLCKTKGLLNGHKEHR